MGTCITGRPWTAAEVELLRELRARKATLAECARQLGRSASAVGMRCQRSGLCRWARPTGDIRARVLAAAEHAGATLGGIATAAGVSTKTVQSVLVRAYGAVPERVTRNGHAEGHRKAWATRHARHRPQRAAAQDRVLALLVAGPQPADVLARECGRRIETVYTLLYRLRAKGQVFPEALGPRRNDGLRWHSVGQWLAANEKLVWWCARRATAPNRRRDLREEAVQSAATELKLLAYQYARSFRPHKGTTFTSYFTTWGTKTVRQQTREDFGGLCGHGMGTATDLPGVAHLSALGDPDGSEFPLTDPREPGEPREACGPAAVVVADLLRRAAGLLAPQEDRSIRMLYLDGLTEAAAAERMGVTRSAVNQYKRNALDKLRDRFGGAA